ncbi:MAG: helix-hairpin-helix domain-containing protein, partial [Candidatus Fimimonas sp.]
MELTVKGTVAGIIFRNEENGYSVLSLDTTDGDDIVCVGSFPTLTVGTVLQVSGKVSVHNKYGEQLAVETYTVLNPTNKEGIIKYLSSGLIKGVGEVTATNIYNMFGDDTFGVIESNPALLAKVKGISSKKAMDIANAVARLKIMQEQVMFLQSYGISTNLSVKIYNIYKGDTKEIVSQNPYRLIDDVDGVGFLTADKIAQSMSIPVESQFRVRAAMVYSLKDTAEKQGNTFLYFDDLLERCSALLQLDLSQYDQLVDETVSELVLEPTVKCFEVSGKKAVALLRENRQMKVAIS